MHQATVKVQIASKATAKIVARIIVGEGGDFADYVSALDALLWGDGQAPTTAWEVNALWQIWFAEMVRQLGA